MGDLLRPAKVHVVSKEGECQVNIVIDLNINLTTEGVALKSNRSERQEAEKEEEEKTIWAIPNFTQQNKVKFGKKKEQE